MKRFLLSFKTGISVLSLGLLTLTSQAQFKLQLFHTSDLEGGVEAIGSAPHFAAIIDTLEEQYSNTLILSAGDNYISGPFYSSSDARSVRDSIQKVYDILFGGITNNNLREGPGRVDLSIMNVIGFNASAMGNHEFDLGTAAIEGLIAPEVRSGPDVRWVGNMFPYLSCNLDFSGDGNLNSLYESTIKDADDYKFDYNNTGKKTKAIAPATIVTVGGQKIGIVGATTPRLKAISSPGDTKVKNPGAGVDDMNALATHIQPYIDSLITNHGVNKIIVVSHLQQYQLEEALAPLLSGVDIIVSGGSDGIFANPGQRLHAGDVAVRPYPVLLTNKDSDPVAIVSTDGQYSYVGHLVVDFNSAGVLQTSSIDATVSRPYPTDSLMVDSLWGFDYNKAFSGNRKGDLVTTLTDAVSSIVIAKDGNIVGKSDVFLDGRRETVRTQEANMGNLTADANLWQAAEYDPAVVVSLKNGGGIRAAIGSIVEVAPGQYEYSKPAGNTLSGKKEGEVSQLDLENTMKFNNKLSIIEVKPSGLRQLFEHGISAWAPGATPGQMPQVGGCEFSFDPNGTSGSKIHSFVIVDTAGKVTDTIVKEGVLHGDTNRVIKMVTLNFLAGGGDSYPFPAVQLSRVDMDTISTLPSGNFTFAVAGSEQDALAEYMFLKHNTTPYDAEETPMKEDHRIQILSVRPDGIFPVKLEFQESLLETDEAAGTVTVSLDYENTTSQNKAVNVRVNSMSTATEGSDFSVSTKSFTAMAGMSGTFTFDVTITDDTDKEEDEYIALEVDPGDNHLLDQGYTFIYVDDNDRTAPTPSKAVELRLITSYDAFRPADVEDADTSLEIVAYDKHSQRLFVANAANSSMEILDFSDPNNISVFKNVDISAYGGINSIAVNDAGIVACAMEDGSNKQAPGNIAFFDTAGTFLNSVTVGVLPDMVAFTHSGEMAVVACEGEPNDDYDVDPEGSIAIVDISSGVSNATATILDFNAYDSQIDQLRNAGVRIFGNFGRSSVSQDMEPEYVTISSDDKTAWVACQENNALVIVDLDAKSITDIKALGTKDHSVVGNGLDGNRDHSKEHISNYPLKGFYHPDAISSYEVGGTTYIVTANEGDARDYDGYSEEVRFRKKDIRLDPVAFPNEDLAFDLIGDIKITTANGDTDGDGDFDEIYTYGARSFTIWNGTTGAKVYDSENQMEMISSNHEKYSPLFNATNDPGSSRRNRSDDKGPEPEAVVLGELSGKTYAFVGAERSGGIYVWDVTDPTAVNYVDHHNNRDTVTADGDLGPEGVVFIPHGDSPNKVDLLVIANEVSSTITVYHVFDPNLDTSTGPSFVEDLARMENELLVYPNPSNGFITVSLPNSNIQSVEVINLYGAVVQRFDAIENSEEFVLDLSGENGRFFVLKLNTTSGTLSKPVVIE